MLGEAFTSGERPATVPCGGVLGGGWCAFASSSEPTLPWRACCLAVLDAGERPPEFDRTSENDMPLPPPLPPWEEGMAGGGDKHTCAAPSEKPVTEARRPPSAVAPARMPVANESSLARGCSWRARFDDGCMMVEIGVWAPVDAGLRLAEVPVELFPSRLAAAAALQLIGRTPNAGNDSDELKRGDADADELAVVPE